MQGLISTIERTRKTAAEILETSLSDLNGKTEADVRDEIIKNTATLAELFPQGWYDPPPGGVAILCAEAPFERLKFETLRDERYWPARSERFGDETTAMVYMSPVDRATGMFGDIGLTVYRGSDMAVRDHVRVCHDLLLQAAEKAGAGMRFSDLYASSIEMFEKEAQKVIGWMTTFHDPLKINLGHTVPGTYGDGPVPLDNFDETREAIRTRRIYINEIESFTIPDTCAFTMEARLTDMQRSLPNTFFHIIVTFENGRRRVLTDFDDIFRTVGMEYML